LGKHKSDFLCSAERQRFPIPVALSETRSYNCHEVKGVVVYPKEDNFYHACHGKKQGNAKIDKHSLLSNQKGCIGQKVVLTMLAAIQYNGRSETHAAETGIV
jgi:hypothetical protein